MKFDDFIQTQDGDMRTGLEAVFANFPPDAPVLTTTIQPGSCILQQDEACRNIFILIKGTCRGLIHQVDSRVLAFEDFKAIHWFGEYEILAGWPRSIADVRALTTCKFLTINAEDYRQWMLNDPPLFMQRVHSVMNTLLRQTEQSRSSLYLNSQDRLKKFLLEYYDSERETAEKTGRVRVNKTHAAIGEEIGFSLRTVNRAINQLAEEGAVGLERGKMVVTPAQYAALQETLGKEEPGLPGIPV